MMVRGQTLGNGELNQMAIWAAIDGYGIKDRIGAFEKVLKVFSDIVKMQREQGDEG
jgi:hypothetical protein